jgi:type VI secretion system protein ImpL
MTWLWIGLTIIGVLAFSVLVWFAGPLIFIADVQPLGSDWLRLTIILVVVLVTAAYVGFLLWRRRKAEAALEKGIAEASPEESDAAVLGERIHDAIATLKRTSHSKGGYLYELPWYLIIGPPGAGKTTALVNSGLKFPLAQGQAAAVPGVGGTRYCDWWFTDRAILIDTAGRYTTQDSDAKADRTSWLAFLNLLKKNRPRQPINGVIVAISIEDVLTGSRAEVTAHADAIRKRLAELYDTFKISFPVYAVFTKMDLVAGFMEYFADLDEGKRQVVWGATFQTADKKANKTSEVPAEIDLLVARLTEALPQRMQEEPDLAARAILFGFPAQVAALKKPVSDFLAQIFEPTRYQSNATLRGFYFTSGTQEGTPIDQIVGALQRSFGIESYGAAAFSGLGKTYFLKDLFEKVIFGEAGWVSTNIGAIRRSILVRAGAFTAVAVAALAVLGAWWVSYASNSALITETGQAAKTYVSTAGPLLQQTEVSDIDLRPVYERIDGLLRMPTGYAHRDDPTPIDQTFGLSQRDRLQVASEDAYHVALERLFRPRLILRLEQEIQRRINEPSFVVEALKVYLMLGNKAPRVDKELIVSWFERDWEENMYPGGPYAKGREALKQHLVAMLDMDNGQAPAIALNGPLVEQAQTTLARMSVAERAYSILKADARNLPIEDWVAARRGGPDTELVFETANGTPLDTVKVPSFYTYDGFYSALLDRMPSIAEALEKDRWVMGEAGEQAAIKEQYASLLPDILRLYGADFTSSWNAAINNLRLRPLVGDKPKYLHLSAASAATSPIRQLLESLRDETALTRERAKAEEAQDPAEAAKDAAAKAANKLGAASEAVAAALRSQQRPGEPRIDVPGRDIEANFKPLHSVVDGAPGNRPIDSLLVNLDDLYRNLTLSATDPTKSAQAVSQMQVQVASLRANASRLPQPLSSMVQRIADDVGEVADDTSIAQLTEALASEVSGPCTQVIANRYPFAKSERDVPMADFSRLFAPNGVIDRFFFNKLAPLVDTSGKTWAWRSNISLARDLSGTTLRQFQQAAQIRDAFFPTGGTQPAISLEVKPLTLSADAESATLQLNASQVVVQPTNLQGGVVQWPGAGSNVASIQMLPELPDRLSKLQRTGAWSLFRLLDAGAVLQRGNAVTASFVVGGREVSFQFAAASLQNPLTLPALRQFRCPNGL